MSATKDATGTNLRPRARILRTLGQELISSEVVALIELVKNAYDADATRILIRFVGPLEPGKGRIEVIDNGHGMSVDTVRTVWMEPATVSKRERIRSEKFKRRYLGEKGIGRFASSRLADEMEVVSRREGQKKETFAFFDWRQFDDDNRYLDEILFLWDEREARDISPTGVLNLLWRNERKKPSEKELSHGTVLRMSGLKQKWETKHFEDLRRGLARLVSPQKRKDSEKSEGDEFEIELDLPTEFSQFSSRVESPAILKHPHYRVKGSISSDGKYSLTYYILSEGIEKTFRGEFMRIADAKGRYEVRAVEADANGSVERPDNSRPIACGGFDLELRVWDRDELGNVVQKTDSTIKEVRRDLDAIAGINLYRDGFRVLPYGEPQDDWLRLDLRRVQNPTLRLSNNQIFGVVHIGADSNPNLRDQSNREGLDENQALDDLREVITSTLAILEEMRYEARPRAGKANNKAAGGLFSGFDFKPLTDYIRKALPKDSKAKEILEKTEDTFEGQLKELQTVIARYQRLATLGQLIDHVLHEGRQPIAGIKNEAEIGISESKSPTVDAALVRGLESRFTTIHRQGDVLATAFRRMEPFGGRRRGRPSQLYIENIIRDAGSIFAAEIQRLSIKITYPRTQTLVRVDPAETQEIFINLIQNSIYWLEQVNEASREIQIKVERKGADHVDILFSDSGPGVPVKNRELIFEPYFSTRKEGVGLGLSIVGEIISDYYGGTLELLDRGPLKGANFLITLRKRV